MPSGSYAAAGCALGAEISTGARVLGWERGPGGLRVRTASAVYETRRLVVTAGPWVGGLLPELRGMCRPERQVMLWTAPLRAVAFEPERFPVFNLEAPSGTEAPSGRYYGFPDDRGEGFKIGKYYHLRQSVSDPDRLDRQCHPEDEAVLREGIAAWFPEADGATRRMAACMFTNTPDTDFVLDRCGGADDVFVAAGFSGHGFKFCSVVGRVMAELCLGQIAELGHRPLPADPGARGGGGLTAGRTTTATESVMPESALTIRALTARAVAAPLARPLRTASGDIPVSPLLLVDVASEEGPVGRAYVFGYTTLALRALKAFLEGRGGGRPGTPGRARGVVRRSWPRASV